MNHLRSLKNGPESECTSAQPGNGFTNSSKIAVIGMACRFPGGACTPDAYWQLLKHGVDATVDVPGNRWSRRKYFHPDRKTPCKSYVNRGGFLRESIDLFDAAFFGMSPREATPLDPQQRLLLEVVAEALEDAFIVPATLNGSDAGVFIGGFTMDNKIHLLNPFNRENISSHTAISSTAGMLSNRISFTFGFRGPSMTIDTACSSSLVALDAACGALHRKDASMAIVGGVNIMIRPEYTIAMCKGGFLSGDGRCKSFDATADGYGRGEGSGVLILKSLNDAMNDGDRIHAIIAGTGVNQDGRSDSITSPAADAQAALMEKVQLRAGVTPDQIRYVEAHGTGTRVGDRTEAFSIGQAISLKQAGKRTLPVGSVKSNIGHLEAAAGMAGIIKAILVLKNEVIPPSLHFHTPNPEIPFGELKLEVVTHPTPITGLKEEDAVAVNGFGYGGTNAHVILQPWQRTEVHAETVVRSVPQIIPITAASRWSLVRRIQQISRMVEQNPNVNLSDLGYTLATRKAHHSHRFAVVASDMDDLRNGLYPFNQTQSDHPSGPTGPTRALKDRKIAYIFTGMGPQHFGMGMDLLGTFPKARQLLLECDRFWTSLSGWSLHTLFERRDGGVMSAPIHAQPANFVLQLMIARILENCGFRPDAVLGHSVGEIAAAVVSGSITLEDALTIIYHRSTFQQKLTGQGKMIAVGLSESEIGPYLDGMQDIVSVAAVNGPDNVTLAGAGHAIDALAVSFSRDGHFNKLLKTDVAYHSYQMSPFRNEFLSLIRDVQPTVPGLPLYSTVTGDLISSSFQDADYWWRNAGQTVCFKQAISAMVAAQYNTFVEIGPHPVLSGVIHGALRAFNVEGSVFASQHRKENGAMTLATAMASLFAAGVDIDWHRQYPSGKLVDIGPYPFEREKFWQETSTSRYDRVGIPGHPLISKKPDEPCAVSEGELNGYFHPFLLDHQIQEEAVFPAAGFVELALASAPSMSEAVTIESMAFIRSLPVQSMPKIRICYAPDQRKFSIFSKEGGDDAFWRENSRGAIRPLSALSSRDARDFNDVLKRCATPVDISALYSFLSGLGLHYSSLFQCLTECSISSDEMFAHIALKDELASEVMEYCVHPCLLDAAFQAFMAIVFADMGNEAQTVFLPATIERLHFYGKPGANALCHGQMVRCDENEIRGNVQLFDAEGNLCVDIVGFVARSVSVADTMKESENVFGYDCHWMSLPISSATPSRPKNLLIFCDTGKVGEQFIMDCRAHDIRCIEVHPGMGFQQHSENVFTVSRNNADDMRRMFDAVEPQVLDGIVYLWGMDIPPPLSEDTGEWITGIVDVRDVVLTVQQLERARVSDRFTFCIGLIQSQIVSPADSVTSPGQTALTGICRTLYLEYPEYQFRTIDLGSRLSIRASRDILAELLSDSPEPEVAMRAGRRYVSRVEKVDIRQSDRQTDDSIAYAYIQESNHFIEISPRPPRANEVQIRVSDCLPLPILKEADSVENKGRQPVLKRRLSFYCAGTVMANATGESGFEIGQPVAILTPVDSLESVVNVDAAFVYPFPEHILPEVAVRLPDWIMAWHALFHIGKIGKDDVVFIHHGTDGVSLAMIALAQSRGATVVASEWSPERREILRQKGVRYVTGCNGREIVDDVQRWIPQGQVKMVFGPSSGEHVRDSLPLIEDGGCYVCLRSVQSESGEPVSMHAFTRDLRIRMVDLQRLCKEMPMHVMDAIRNIGTYLEVGTLNMSSRRSAPISLLPERSPQLLADSNGEEEPFRLKSNPVPLVRWLPTAVVSPDATYIVTGGFSGLGLATMNWLAQDGAQYIAVLSRSGPCTSDARAMLRHLADSGVTVFDKRVDVTLWQSVKGAINELRESSPGIRGVFHFAAQFADAPVQTMTIEQVNTAMSAKALGAYYLHRALYNVELDAFVVASSIAGMLGNREQANYAAANSFLDGLMRYRNQVGRHGMSVQWGPVSDAGYVSRNHRVGDHLEKLGIRSMSAQEGFKLLAIGLQYGRKQQSIFEVDWKKFIDASEKRNPRIENLVTQSEERTDSYSSFRSSILNMTPGDRFDAVARSVIDTVSEVLRVNSKRIEYRSSLIELGIDSLMATELIYNLRKTMGVRFRTLFILRGPSVGEIARLILDEIIHHRPESVIAVK